MNKDACIKSARIESNGDSRSDWNRRNHIEAGEKNEEKPDLQEKGTASSIS